MRILPPVCLALLVPLVAQAVSLAPPNGLRENTPSDAALVGARIVTQPGKVIESGTIVIRNGKIESVVQGEAVPPGAERVDLAGKTVYAGFIDAYTSQSITQTPAGPAYWNGNITPQREVADSFKPDSALNKSLRSQGFGAMLVAPRDGIIKGQSCLALTGDGDSAGAILAPSVAQHVVLNLPSGRRGGYPNSPMGAVALARQAMYDAQWYAQAMTAAQANPRFERPDLSAALKALTGYLNAGGLVLMDAPNELYATRNESYAREFSLRIAMIGSGNEYRRLNEWKQTGRAVIVPVDFPKPPGVASPEAALSASLADLMHWRLAPENPGRLAKAGVTIALTTDGLSNHGDFLKQLRKAIKRGLDPDEALRALTTVPAELFNVDDSLGTVQAGKIANLVVTDGDIFEKGKVVATWVNGKPYEMKTDPVADFRGKWKLTAAKRVGGEKKWKLDVTGRIDKLSAKIGPVGKPEATIAEEPQKEPAKEEANEQDAPKEGAAPASPPHAEEDAADEDKTPTKKSPPEKTVPKSESLKPLKQSGYRLTGVFKLKGEEFDGRVTFTATLVSDGDDRLLSGLFRLADGSEVPFTGTIEKAKDEKKAEEKSDKKPKKDDPEGPLQLAINYPLGAYGLTEQPKQLTVALTNATVWTCGPDGVVENATVVIQAGKITAVGADVEVPGGVKKIDCRGKHISPGIIDCHSHIATDGGINESGQAVTAEVRIGDRIDPDDITIYRHLAGGVTSSNILHGSANPIGGQNQVLKFRWGAGAEEMRFEGAPFGIKFALGENVKQSNWSRGTGRYPQSRMGVDELMIDEFRAAQAYRAQWRRWERTREGLPPRRDLELDTIVEILEHKRWIHCHSYKQSEILALLRTLESFNIRIGTLQHILEGYKLAPEMAAHGAMGSSFSDWWAYKYEVYDAIPHNGTLMHDAGVVVSFNSDDKEMGRRLNQEAAKAVKYGGTPPEEALKFVTLNPAKQLRIDDRVGSLEVGKDADLVVWSGEPLSTYSRCEQTWVDGRRYFDLKTDAKLRKRDQQLRAELIQAVLNGGEPPAKKGENRKDPSDDWPRYDEYCSTGDQSDSQQ